LGRAGSIPAPGTIELHHYFKIFRYLRILFRNISACPWYIAAMDILLLIIGLLLIATLTAFITGLITYPCGILVFSLFFVGRLIYLYDKNQSS
jgi:hypothetical protein